MITEPRSIQEIYRCIRANAASVWRIRNVVTHEDYCIIGIKEFDVEGFPMWFKAWRLDYNNLEVQLWADAELFGLLSCKEEIEYFNKLNLVNIYNELRHAYGNFGFEFGEG